jgi:hypothetical protein
MEDSGRQSDKETNESLAWRHGSARLRERSFLARSVQVAPSVSQEDPETIQPVPSPAILATKSWDCRKPFLRRPHLMMPAPVINSLFCCSMPNGNALVPLNGQRPRNAVRIQRKYDTRDSDCICCQNFSVDRGLKGESGSKARTV